MIFGVSKTTINGILALAIVVLTNLTLVQLPSIATPGASHVWLWVTFVASSVAGILRAVVGYLQNDTPPQGAK
jgi:hypothetical protein